MHQPYYRSADTGAFEMPWARMHALKDYLDMVETLGDYPDLHQTFNLVPSLVEQLEDYASGDSVDVYWEHTLKPAAELTPGERAFVLERMCERPDHPRAHSHPRYLELAHKRDGHAAEGWEACARLFTVDELRDLQVWFNLAWFDPRLLETEPLADLVRRGRDYAESDKEVLAQVQTDILTRTLPAYREAAGRGQVELSTSPYFHPILPLLANSDLARISAPDTLLPPRRFAHPADASEHVSRALLKHERVFGEKPRGIWCSEQAVGEDVLPLLIEAGLTWTISDETVLARSLSGAAPPWAGRGGVHSGGMVPPGQGRPPSPSAPMPLTPSDLYRPYRLTRDEGGLSIVFRDHTLSDLIGFAYNSWDSRDGAADLLRRLRELRSTLAHGRSTQRDEVPLVTIALDGENAWEYYPRDGRDFLQYLYEGLVNDPVLRCVTVSEHLAAAPPERELDWLHTGSWIGGNLRTWSGDRAHNAAWDLLHRARDVAAAHRTRPATSDAGQTAHADHATAWRHVLIAEGSDWFWWFGDHHHTELDHVWDLSFRRHLQAVYRSLGETIPVELHLPLLEHESSPMAKPPRSPVSPVIDGRIEPEAEWGEAGRLAPEIPSTMQRSESTDICEARFGWDGDRLCVLVVPADAAMLPGLEMEVRMSGLGEREDLSLRLHLEDGGEVEVTCVACSHVTSTVEATWANVLEMALPLDPALSTVDHMALTLHVGRGGMIEHVFHTAGLPDLGWRGR